MVLALSIVLLLVFFNGFVTLIVLLPYLDFPMLNIVFEPGLDYSDYDGATILNCLHGGGIVWQKILYTSLVSNNGTLHRNKETLPKEEDRASLFCHCKWHQYQHKLGLPFAVLLTNTIHFSLFTNSHFCALPGISLILSIVLPSSILFLFADHHLPSYHVELLLWRSSVIPTWKSWSSQNLQHRQLRFGD